MPQNHTLLKPMYISQLNVKSVVDDGINFGVIEYIGRTPNGDTYQGILTILPDQTLFLQKSINKLTIDIQHETEFTTELKSGLCPQCINNIMKGIQHDLNPE